MQTRLIGPIALFVIGIVGRSISGSDKMFLAGGAVLVTLAYIGLMIVIINLQTQSPRRTLEHELEENRYLILIGKELF